MTFSNSKPYLKRVSATLLSLMLAACGGSSESEPEPEQSKQPVTQEQQVFNASALRKVSTQSLSVSQNGAKPLENGVLDATGRFTYPKQANQEFKGNITVQFEAEDADGIRRIYLGVAETEEALIVCENDCGTEFKAMVNGINPGLFSGIRGQVQLTVWVEDNDDNVPEAVDTINVNWQAKIISGVTATIDEATETLSVTWQAHDDMLRYNAYIAQQEGLNGRNVNELEGGESQLSLTTTSAQFANKVLDQNYYVLVTGIDDTGESAFGEALLLIGGTESNPPVATNDSFEGDEDVTLEGSLLTNDSSDEGTTLALVTTPLTPPQHGQLVLNADGSFSYTPSANFHGLDQFTYQVQDSNELTGSAVVSININEVNDEPVALDDEYIIEGDSLSIPTQTDPVILGLLGNDTDVDIADGDNLSVVLLLEQAPKFGVVQVFSDGSFVYTKGESYTTYDNFTYKVTDSAGAEATAVVTIKTPEFNGYPPVVLSSSYQLIEDDLLNISADEGMLKDAFDEDHPLSESSLTVPTLPLHGSLTFGNDGAFNYQPNPDFFGTDSFVFQLTDPDSNQASAVVTLTVTAQNDAPVATSDTYLIANDAPFSINRTLGLLKNDLDIDGNNISVNLETVSQPGSGQVEVASDGSFTYTPASGFIGMDSFTYQVTDGELNSQLATVELNLIEVHAHTDDLTPVTLSLAEMIPGLPANAVVADVVAVHGTASVSGDTLTYTSTLPFGGLDFITLTLMVDESDFTYTLNIRVEQTNSAPFFTSATSIDINENLPLNELVFTVQADDNENDVLTYSITNTQSVFTIDANTGALTVADATALDFETNQSFTLNLLVTDPLSFSDSQTLQINVIDVNEDPVVENDTAEVTAYSQVSISPLDNDSDPEGGLLEIQSAIATNGTVSINNLTELVYSPNVGITEDTISYDVKDPEGLISTAQIAVNVLPLPLIGNHDFDLDQADDLVVSFSAEQQSLNLISQTASHFWQVINNRNYPLERNANGAFELDLNSASATANFVFNKNNDVYDLTLTLDNENSHLLYVKRSFGFTQTFVADDVAGSYINSIPTRSPHALYERATVDPKSEDGNVFQLTQGDTVNTGSFSNLNGQVTFTWQVENGVLLVTKDDNSPDTRSMSLNTLLHESLISQTQYDDYLASLGSEQSMSADQILFEVTEDAPTVTLRMQSNSGLYQTVDELEDITYTLPAEFNNAEISRQEHNRSYRLYASDSLGTYGFSPLSGSYYLPFASYEDGQPENQTHLRANFNSDGSGQLTSTATDFSWQINSDGQLELNFANFSYTYQAVFMGSTHSELLFTAVDSNLAQTISGSAYKVADSSLDTTQLTSLVSDKFLLSSFAVTQVDGTDQDGYLNLSNLFGFFSYSQSADQGPTGFNQSQRLNGWVNEGGSGLSTSDWIWQQNASELTFNSYFSSELGQAICDPNADSGCFLYQSRTLQAKVYDSENNYLWVVEWQDKLDMNTLDSGEPAYIRNIEPRVNFYHLSDLVNAQPDSADVDEEGLLSAIDVLANDTDSQANNTELRLLDANANSGMLAINSDQTIDYSPNPSYFGQDNVQYVVVDNMLGVATGELTVTVNPINDIPIAYDDNATVDEGKSVSIAVIVNDVDVDFDQLTISNFSQGTFGSVTDLGNGELSYLHDGTSNFSDSFTYVINDGTETAQATVFVNITPVNDAPVANDDTAPAINEDASVVINLINNDSDEEGDALSVVNLTTPSFGSLLDHADGTVTYIHDGSENFNDSFKYTISDGALNSNEALVTVTISPVNDAPSVTSVSSFNINENANNGIIAYNAIGSDPENDSLSWSLNDPQGIFTIDANSGELSVSNNSNLDFETLTSYNLDITVSDGSLLDTKTVTVVINNVNEAPVVTSGNSFSINENSEIGSGAGYATTAFDPEADSFTWTLSDPQSIFNIDSSTGLLTVANNSPLDYESFVPYDLTLTATDSNSNAAMHTVTVNVNDVNEAPTAVADSGSVNEGSSVDIDIRSNDSDPETDSTSLTIVNLGTPTNGSVLDNGDGTVSYSHDGSETTSDSFTYQVSDGSNISLNATVSITVTPVNDQPVAIADSATVNEGSNINIDIRANDTDAETSTSGLTITNLGSASNGSLVDNGDGTVTYTHDGSETTSDSFSYQVSDGTDTSLATSVSITVTPVNDVPVAVDDSGAVNEGSSVIIDVRSNDTDAETATTSLTVTNLGSASNGSIVDNGDGTVTYTHDGSQTSADSFTYQVNDGTENSLDATVTISITNENDAPVAVDDSASVVNYASVNIDVLANDTDEENDSLTINSASALTGTVVIESDNTLTYTPDDNVSSDTITYDVSDGALTSLSAQVSVTVDSLGLEGSHDSNNDSVNELTVVNDSVNSEWDLTFSSDVSTLFVITNNRYFPIDPAANGVFSYSIPHNSSDIQLGAVFGDDLHTIDIFDLSATPSIKFDRTGSNLSNDFAGLTGTVNFITVQTVAKDGVVTAQAAINPRYLMGARYQFDTSGLTGNFVSSLITNDYNWSISGSVITANSTTAGVQSNDMGAQQLLSTGLITQDEYDDFIANASDTGEIFTVNYSTSKEVITIIDNQAVYLDVSVVSDTTYTLPTNATTTAYFANLVTTITGDADTHRLYNLDTIATYSMSDISDGDWALPTIDTAQAAVFNRAFDIASFVTSPSQTGSMANSALTFTWSVNGNGQLQLSTSDNIDYTYTQIQSNGEQKSVLLEAVDNDANKEYATLAFLVKNNAPASATVQTMLTSGRVVNSFSVSDSTNFDSAGELTPKNVFSFDFNNAVPSNVPSGELEAKRVYFSDDGSNKFIQQTEWTWFESAGAVTIKAYYDSAQGSYVLCDPDQTPTCYKLRERNWQVLEVDSVNKRVWVLESSERLEGTDPSPTYVEFITPRINYYDIYETLNLVSDTGSAVEDSSSNTIDVLTNDLDSLNAASAMQVTVAHSYNATVNVNSDNTLDYVPNADFQGTDTVSYVAVDQYGAFDVSTVTVTVSNVNDAPTITSSNSTTVAENQTSAIDVEGSDIDGHMLSYALTGSIDDSLFNIDSGSGVIAFNTAPNFESPSDSGSDNTYDVEVTVTDNGTGNLTAVQSISIQVTDVNDAPTFSSSATASVAENQTSAIDVDGVDQDSDILTYTLTGSVDDSLFSINSSTGVVTFNSAPNYETPTDSGSDNIYDIEVTVTDNGTGNLTAVQSIDITVSNSNDAPSITSGNTATVAENQTSAIDVDASDQDSDSLTYALTGSTDDGLFTINSTTGVVTFVSSPNFESPSDVGGDNTYDIQVTVTDSGTGNLTDVQTIAISVTNVNDLPIADNQVVPSFDEDTNAAITLTGSDTDGSISTYTVATSPTNGSLSGTAPNLTYTPNLHYNGVDSFTFTVTDNESGVSTAATVSLTIDAVNDTPYGIGNSPATTSFAENSTFGSDQLVSTFSVSDHDTGDTISWSLVSPTDGNFTINASGQLNLISSPSLDYETIASYNLTVRATDSGGLFIDDSITVTVTNVNEAPVITSGTTFSIDEGLTAITTITATDPEGDVITFAVPGGGDDYSEFAINSSTGALSFVSARNFESPIDMNGDNAYEVEVEASDGQLPSNQFITINVNDVVENTELVLDAAFGDAGLVNFNTFANTQDTVTSVSDLLVEVKMDDLGNNFVLVNTGSIHSVTKIKSDGSIDTSFGNQGRKFLNYASLQDVNVQQFSDHASISGFTPRHLEIDTDSMSSHYGKIYVYGYQFNGTYDFPFVVRLNTDGTIDNSFGGDGKYNYSALAYSAEPVDLLLHSDGWIYLAVNHRSVGDGLTIIKLNTTGNSVSYVNTFDQQLTQNVFIKGIVENATNEVVVFGYLDSNGRDLIAARVDKDDFSPSLLAASTIYDLSSNSNDLASSYVQTDNNTVYLGGSTDINMAGEQDPMIAKLSLSSATFDASFASATGYYLDSFSSSATDDEEILNMAVNNNGDVSFTLKVTPETATNQHLLYVSQIDANGIITGAGSSFSAVAKELTETSGSGIANNAFIKAQVLHDTADASNTFRVFSSFETVLPSSSIQVQNYFKEFDTSAVEQNRWQYDFLPVKTRGIEEIVTTSSNELITIVDRENEMGETPYGFSVFKHKMNDGQWDQTFATQGSIERDAVDYDFITQYGSGAVELSDGTFILVSVKEGSSATDIIIEQFNPDGSEKTDSGFPVTYNNTNNVQIDSVVYNANANRILLVGHEYNTNSDSMAIMLDSTTGAEVFNVILDVFGAGAADRLFDGVIANDGSVIALGTGDYFGQSRDDGFLIRFSATGVIDTTFDANGGDSDDALEVEFDPTNSTTYQIQQLEMASDGSLIIAGYATANGNSYLVRVIEDSGNPGQYMVDTNFDFAVEGTDSDDFLDLNIDSLAQFGSASVRVYDMTIDNNDNIWVVGYGNFVGHDLGFVGKINAITGTYDTFGKNTLNGYFVPGGRANCSANSNDVEINICDAAEFDTITIAPDGSIILGTTVNGVEGKVNSAIFKFSEQQNDTATSYSVESGGA